MSTRSGTSWQFYIQAGRNPQVTPRPSSRRWFVLRTKRSVDQPQRVAGETTVFSSDEVKTVSSESTAGTIERQP
jgi:hypothetical protein